MITIFILLAILPPVHNDSIFFEEIGEITTTISYLQIFIPVDIQGLKEKPNLHISQIRDFKRANQDRSFQWKNDNHNNHKVQYTKEIRGSFNEATLR
jgi:hypothetical protein